MICCRIRPYMKSRRLCCAPPVPVPPVFLRRCFAAERRSDEHEPVLGVLAGVDVSGASAD